MKVRRLDHIHIYVKDIDKAKAQFSHLLNTEFSPTMVDEKYGMCLSIDPLGIELVAPLPPDSSIAKDIERWGEGVHGISLKVDDVEEAAADLTAAGLRMVGRVDVGGLKEVQFHPRDTFGVMLEICQYREVHGMVRATSEQ